MKDDALKTDIAVIGGGASALALAAMMKNRRVSVFERGARVGKKLLSTGNGKCNLTSVSCAEKGYNRPDFVHGFLLSFPPESAIRFFGSVGLVARVTEEGRVYPFSECASSVLDVLISAAERNGACLFTRREVKCITPAKGGFLLDVATLDEKNNEISTQKHFAENVVLATGSCATFGSDSLSLYVSLGHKARPFVPSLVPLKTDRESVKGLNGVRVKCAVTLCGEREEGEILFRDYGLSGICALNLSALYARGVAKKGDKLSMDFAPSLSEEEIASHIGQFKDLNAECILRGMFHSKVAERIMARAGQTPSLAPDAPRLAETIKKYDLSLQGTLDASYAQVMSGGLVPDEFDDNLQSRIRKGLYAMGEALDVDGICGGYNLQWAWMSAAAVARGLTAKR